MLMVRALLRIIFVSLRLLRRGCGYLIGVWAISVILSAAGSTAHGRDASGDRSVYEPSGVETVGGWVARVETLPRAGGGSRDVTLVLRTGIGDEVRVAVAPQWVSKAMGLRFREGDDVQVAGWRIVRGKPALLAAEIRTGTQLFVLRDRHGVAVWGPRRRLRPPPAHRIDPPE